MCENGNGKWIKYTNNFHEEFEEGAVKDSLEEGEWHSKYYTWANYVTIYNKGVVISSTDINQQNIETIGGIKTDVIFSVVEKEPEYKNGGLPGLYRFLSKTIHYPYDAKQNNIQGKVLVTFVVEKDGTVSNVKALRSPGKSLADEAVRAVTLSPHWIPGMQNNKAVRVQYTIPINFNLSNSIENLLHQTKTASF